MSIVDETVHRSLVDAGKKNGGTMKLCHMKIKKLCHTKNTSLNFYIQNVMSLVPKM